MGSAPTPCGCRAKSRPARAPARPGASASPGSGETPRATPARSGPGEAGHARAAGPARVVPCSSGSRGRNSSPSTGEEELAQERQARLEERRSRARGAGHRARFEQFRAALENYVSEVRPGNQTALDAAASPFATFLSDMHRRIHGQFADRYLASLPMDAPEGQNDPTLATTLEIAVNPDGTVPASASSRRAGTSSSTSARTTP